MARTRDRLVTTINSIYKLGCASTSHFRIGLLYVHGSFFGCRTSSSDSLVDRLLSPPPGGSRDGCSRSEMQQYERTEAALRKELVSILRTM